MNLCVYQPPLRTNFYATCKFLFDIKKNNNNDNYIYIQKKPINKAYYIVNSDKVSKYNDFNTDESKVIEINNKDLIEMLINSYNNDPNFKKREYVFMSSNEKPYPPNKITQVLLEPLNLNFDTLRSSYISDYYLKNPYPLERSKLAKAMRHGPDVAQLKYLKRIPTDKQEKEINKNNYTANRHNKNQ